MFTPTLDFLRRVVHPAIRDFTTETIQVGANPSRIDRLTLAYLDGITPVASVIVKTVTASWPDDPHGPDRERRVYAQLVPHLDVVTPHLYYNTVDAASGDRVLVMEDLSLRYRFPAPQHRWTWDEMRCVLHTYAQLHVSGRSVLPSTDDRGWLLAPWHTYLDGDILSTMVADLVAWGVWRPLPGIDELLAQTVHGIPELSFSDVTFLHNDVYPPNVALPFNLNRDAVLIDWGMASWGQAEVDLAYLFMQPFRSARWIHHDAALDCYWAHRRSLGDSVPSDIVREQRQLHAEAVLALAIVRVAHRVAQHPFPDGSAPRAYWNAMFGVLEARLRELCSQSTAGTGRKL